MSVDELDARLVTLFTEEPGVSVLEASRRLGVARPTVQARLDRLHTRGVIRRIEPVLDPTALGYPVMAICQAEVDQAAGSQSIDDWLVGIPEVLDMYTTSGDSDVVLRVVARSNRDLQRVLDRIMESPAVIRTRSSIVLRTHFENKLLPLLRAAAGPDAQDSPTESKGSQSTRAVR